MCVLSFFFVNLNYYGLKLRQSFIIPLQLMAKHHRFEWQPNNALNRDAILPHPLKHVSDHKNSWLNHSYLNIKHAHGKTITRCLIGFAKRNIISSTTKNRKTHKKRVVFCVINQNMVRSVNFISLQSLKPNQTCATQCFNATNLL